MRSKWKMAEVLYYVTILGCSMLSAWLSVANGRVEPIARLWLGCGNRAAKSVEYATCSALLDGLTGILGN
jgi:hypothetical protein